MKTRVFTYGTKYNCKVISSSKDVLIVEAVGPSGTKEAFVMAYPNLTKLPVVGDTGKIVFEKGGPMKGYWQYYPE